MPNLLGQLADGGLGSPDAQRLAGNARENPVFLRGGANLAPPLQPLAGGWGKREIAGCAAFGHSAGDGDGALLHVLPSQQGGLSHAHGANHHQHHQGGIAGAGCGEHGADLIGVQHSGSLDGAGAGGAIPEEGAMGGAAGGGSHGPCC